ncbi:MAG: NYN domain-containing protein [Casimicrobiaceae bacterium]
MTQESGSATIHPRLAVLIDADNAQPSVIEGVLAEVAKFGVASVKRIYGDWTSTGHAQWKLSLLKHSISPIQQFAYTRGKNATDSSLIIDAMDLMHTQRFDGFCLVSSDSDFTRLAQRLREEGLTVLGFGERKTPESFVAACDKFVYTEVLRPDAAIAIKFADKPFSAPPIEPEAATRRPSKASAGAEVLALTRVATSGLPSELILQAIEDASDDSGWAHLGAVGSLLTKLRPDFDSRLYGSKKLSDLLKKHPHLFTLEERGSAGLASKVIYVRAALAGSSR